MTLTAPILAIIARRLRDPSLPKITQADLAAHMGYGKSWASKLMAGKLLSITDNAAYKLEDFLGVRLMPYFEEVGGPTPELAKQIGRKMSDNEPLTRIISALLELQTPIVITEQKWIKTQDMTKIGQEIIKLVFANDDKPGKVARLVLELLSHPPTGDDHTASPPSGKKSDKPFKDWTPGEIERGGSVLERARAEQVEELARLQAGMRATKREATAARRAQSKK